MTELHAPSTRNAGGHSLSTAALSTREAFRPSRRRSGRGRRRLLTLVPLGTALLIVLAACAPGSGDATSSAAVTTTPAPVTTQSATASITAAAAAPIAADPAPSEASQTVPPVQSVQPAPALAPLVASAAAVPAAAATAEEQSDSEAPQAPAAPAAAAPVSSGYGCDAALAYLRANAEPSYQLVCPGYAYGGQAVTCNHHAPQCADYNIIIINVPCENAYKNEAANSWTLVRNDGATMDPFGATC
jgi:hypothetical protein